MKKKKIIGNRNAHKIRLSVFQKNYPGGQNRDVKIIALGVQYRSCSSSAHPTASALLMSLKNVIHIYKIFTKYS